MRVAAAVQMTGQHLPGRPLGPVRRGDGMGHGAARRGGPQDPQDELHGPFLVDDDNRVGEIDELRRDVEPERDPRRDGPEASADDGADVGNTGPHHGFVQVVPELLLEVLAVGYPYQRTEGLHSEFR